MSDHIYHYTDNDLSLNQAHSYNLLLQINASSFNYAITFNKQLLAWAGNFPLSELNDPQELREILNANYKEVIIGLASSGFTLLPQGLYDKGQISGIARLLDVHGNEKVYCQPLNKENDIIYKTDQQLNAGLAGFDNESINHKASGWIKALTGTHPADSNLYINVADETVELVCFSNNKLRFYNTFAFKHDEELAYYCAFVAREIEIVPEAATLIISGDISIYDKSFTYLKEFFGEVILNPMQILETLPQVDPHKILTLAALLLCASSEEN